MGGRSLSEVIDTLSLTYHLGNTPLGIIVWDDRLKVTYWSARAREIFGWPESMVLQHTPSELNLVHEEDREHVLRVMEDIRSGRVLRNHSINRNLARDGSILYCEWYNSALKDESGHVQSILSMVLDITKRTQLELDLEKSEKQLSLIYNSAIDPMWLIAVEGESRFRFQTINHSFTAVTGLMPGQVIGRLIEEVLPATSHELVREKYNEAIRTGKVIDYVEIAVHPAGKKYGEIRVIPIKDREGAVTQILGIANDITERQLLYERLDQEREINNRKVTHAAIKGQELERRKVSRELHDHVNQVLTTVKLYTELCASGTVDNQTYLPKCTVLLNETISEIRDLSKRLYAPSIGEVSLVDTLKELADSVSATGKMKVETEVAEFEWQMVHSELHLALYRIAQEQLTNILKHANADQVTISLKVEDSRLCLLIRDNGTGFDPRKKRSGIGITNMVSRAQLLNGTVEIDSAPGQGCTMSACIPVEIIDGICFPVNERFEV